ncbi:hypothetical protein GCM10023155_00680 [Bremerella cremea]
MVSLAKESGAKGKASTLADYVPLDDGQCYPLDSTLRVRYTLQEIGMSEETSLPIETTCLDVNNLQKENADFLLLDCREQNEFDLVRIEGSTLIPMSELQDRVGELEPHRQRHIVVHCHHGGRSMRVTQWLRQQGFPKVQNMAGGINAWAQDIDPSMPTY